MKQKSLPYLVVILLISAFSAKSQLTYIYCTSGANGDSNDVSDIGGFSFGSFVNTTGGQHYNNSQAKESYSNYTSKDIIAYVDSSYYVEIYHTLKGATQVDAKVTMFIDFNNNGYLESGELVWTDYTNSNNIYIHTTLNIVEGTLTKNVWTLLRVVLNNQLSPSTASDMGCGNYTSGETEDYKIKFLSKPKLSIENSPEENVSITPNPSSGVFTIANSGAFNKLTVLNQLGQPVYQSADISNRQDLSFSISQQPTGVYYLILESAGDRLVKKLQKL